MIWTLPDGTTLELDATIGKPLDVLALKATSLAEIREYAEHLARTAAALYGGERRELAECPCCGEDAAGAATALEVHGVPYGECPRCGHLFVVSQPAAAALESHFAEAEALSEVYTDPETVEVRMAQVVAPKLEWSLDVFRRLRGRSPRSAVDVGAGGGHVVAGLRRAGLAAEGFELSEPSRRFARDAFDVELRAEDFAAADVEAELVTMWGLLEYVPDPRRLLEAARRAVGAEGLVVVEVPRARCLGTAVQRRWPDTVARHLDPTSHVNTFTDESLAIALLRSGLRPVAAWYFGMDAYELAVQLGLQLGEEAFPALAEALLPLQAGLDRDRYCDDLVVAAVPA